MPILVLVLLALLAACDTKNSTSTDTPFTFACDLNTSYSERAAAVTSPAEGTPKATVIVLHGKTGSPLSSFLVTLTDGLNVNGYDVIAPYMPWSQLDWDGTVCQGMAYLNGMVAAEKAKGNQVIVVGHSLAGPIVSGYAALANSEKPDAFVLLAPGHFIHHSKRLASAHAQSIQTANTMIANGQDDVIATFQTSNGGVLQNLSTTPRIYLSFHSTDEFPNIEASLPIIEQPVLWLTGNEDSLTETAQKFGLDTALPKTNNNLYKIISGNHYTIMSVVPGELDNWFQGFQ